MPGRVVVQWDKEDCADLGIIKVDLLGLGMMAVLEETIQIISNDYREEVDLAHLPPDDPAVYAALQQADTIGMFQIESRAQMSCLPRLRPEKFYDIVVQVAIIRPGPIVGNMVNPYLERRLGRAPVRYAHPDLEPVLKRTLGVPLFQEQLLKMAMTCADFSGGEAEELRRAMGFKRSEQRMKEIEKKLRRGMTRKGISGQVQEEIVEQIASFALYGFPESHAASFALIAYASAYLKCHYLAAFTAATLNNQPMGFYQPFTIIKDAQRHGLKVLPVDVTRSNWECVVENRSGQWPVGSGQEKHTGMGRHGDAENLDYATDDRPLLTAHCSLTTGHYLRLGFLCVKGLREEAGRAIVRARAERSFSSLDDLHRRVPELRKDELRKLAAVGALNRIEGVGGQIEGVGGRVLGVEVLSSGLELQSSSAERQRSDSERPNSGLKPQSARSELPSSRSELPSSRSELPSSRSELPSSRSELLSSRSEPPSSGSELQGSSSELQGSSSEPQHSQSEVQRSNEMQLHPTSYPPPPASHRRDALWQVERVARDPGPLYEKLEEATTSPLQPMTLNERLNADLRGTGITIGRHPMAHQRAALDTMKVTPAGDLKQMRNGMWVKVAGWVIVRQRPGTAKGFVFLSMEDETGIANVIVTPQLFETNRLALVNFPFLLIEGVLQHQDNVVSVKARRIQPLEMKVESPGSHDFH